jgi:thiol-disulfide isomerase/thioredoxin
LLLRRVLAPLTLAVVAATAVPTYADEVPSLDLSAYRGKVVLVDFWASWCGPCKESFPWMQQMQSRYADRGLVVIAVNVDQDRKLADQFLRQQPGSLKLVFDPHGRWAEQFHVSAMPSSFYVDRQGNLAQTHLGFHLADRGAFEQQLVALLGQP